MSANKFCVVLTPAPTAPLIIRFLAITLNIFSECYATLSIMKQIILLQPLIRSLSLQKHKNSHFLEVILLKEMAKLVLRRMLGVSFFHI